MKTQVNNYEIMKVKVTKSNKTYNCHKDNDMHGGKNDANEQAIDDKNL